MDIDAEFYPESNDNAVYLPDEIIIQILSYISREPRAYSKWTFAAICLLSRKWYDAAIPLLYGHPNLTGRNFTSFVRTICPSKNAHIIRSPLAELVKVLDLSHLVHEGSKSTTARLIGRTKGQLEEFVAPVATFSSHCFPALSKCSHLKVLDLTLVAEPPPLPDLFRTISHLHELQTLRLPRSSGFGVHHRASSFNWPPNLQELCLSGGIDAHFLHGIVCFPETLRHLTIENCPNAKSHAVTHLLKNAVRPLPNLESLKIAHMPRLSRYALDSILFFLPQLRHLSVAVDYVSEAMFDPTHFHHNSEDDTAKSDTEGVVLGPNLRSLEFTVSSSSHMPDDKLTPIDLLVALDDDALPKLRQVRVARELGWDGGCMREDLERLVEELQEKAREDWVKGEWVFSREKKAVEVRERWKDVAGVWTFSDH